MHIGEARELRVLDEEYPVWERTRWTPEQRTMAIRGLLLLALGGGLIAGCLAVWRTASFAATLLAPLGVTLLCWGVTHLNAVAWYARWHGATTVGERRRRVSVVVELINLTATIDYGTLALQLIGGAVVLVLGPAGWHGLDAFSLAWLMGLPVAMGVVVTVGSYVLTSTLLAWSPRRDPADPDAALGPPARGLRLLLRWLVMVVVDSGPVLVLAPPYVLADSYNALSGGIPDLLPTPQKIAVFGLGAALCLILALSELTNPARAADAPPETREAVLC